MGGFFGNIGHIFNTVTQPFGVKLFGNQDYPDQGNLDKAQQAMGTYPKIGDLGALSGLPQVYSQLAQANGVPDVFAGMLAQVNEAGQPGSVWNQRQQANKDAQGNLPTSSQFSGQPAGNNLQYDPYALSQPSQRYLNQKQSDIGQSHNAAWERVKANLSARGLGDSSSMAAAQAYLNQAYGNQAQEAETSVRGAEFDRKNAVMQQLANALGQIFNAQRQRQLDQAGVFQNQAAYSTAQNNNLMNFYRGLITPFAAQGASSLLGGGGGGLGGGGSSPIFGGGAESPGSAQWYIDNPNYQVPYAAP